MIKVRDHEVDLLDDIVSHSPKSQPTMAPREPHVQRGALLSRALKMPR